MRFQISCVLICLWLFSPLPICAKEKLAVMDMLTKYGVEQGLADALSEEVRDVVHSLGKYSVMSSDDFEMVAIRKQITDYANCDDEKCLIDIGRAYKTRLMVAGSVAKLGVTYKISLRLISTDEKNPGVLNRQTEKCQCKEGDLFDITRKVTLELMGVKKERAETYTNPTTSNLTVKSKPANEIENEKIHRYLKENYKSMFVRHYPSSTQESLSKLKVAYVKKINNELLFNLQCAYTIGGSPLRLILYYLYNPKTDRWTYYNEL